MKFAPLFGMLMLVVALFASMNTTARARANTDRAMANAEQYAALVEKWEAIAEQYKQAAKDALAQRDACLVK